MMTKKLFLCAALVAFVPVLPACAPQNTPSMMNANKIQLGMETNLQQVPVKDASEGYLRKLADDYTRYGSNGLNLTISYDPAKPGNYNAVKSFQDLERIKTRLTKLGVRNITADSVKVDGADPTLMVMFDATVAQAPEACGLLPGLESNQTTRFVGDYRFGCSVDTMLARQVYRPADLAGNDQLDVGDGRRAANSTEHYRVVTESEATKDLEVLGREQIQQ